MQRHHRRIDPRRHDPERIARRDEAVVRLQLLEARLDHADVRKTVEALAERVAHRGVGVHEPEVER
jgi:hypothetical protein